jgi:membrane associated rhomboid family serine protease
MTRKTVTNALMYTNYIMFWLQEQDPSFSNAIKQINRLVTDGQYYRLLSSCFGHESFNHIGSNMQSLFYYGHIAEEKFGASRFAVLYFLSSLVGSIFSYKFLYKFNSIGASGGVCGILGALCIYYYRNRDILGEKEARYGKYDTKGSYMYSYFKTVY